MKGGQTGYWLNIPMTETLGNLKVLVTRPAAQGEDLSRLIEQKGGKVVRLPLLEIGPSDIPADNIINRLSGAEIAIFISNNAVTRASEYYGIGKEALEGLKIVAIGQSTADCLKRNGLDNVIYPDRGSDSEALLALGVLQEKLVHDKKIVIFRGNGGRETLAEVLRQRGAEVTYLEVYKRSKPRYEQEYLDTIINDFNPDVIIITSNESLNNLFEIIKPQHRKFISNKIFLVMSKRIADLGKSFDISRIVITEKPGDQGIIDALERLNLSENR